MSGILAIGEALGVVATTERGRFTSGGTSVFRVAGSELNVSIALARLGVPVWFAGAVGPDPVGFEIRRMLLAEGVNIDLVELGTRPTGLLFKERYGVGQSPRVFYFRQSTSMHSWRPEDTWVDSLPVNWVHLSGITLMIDAGLRADLLRWLKLWSQRKAGRLSVDLNLRYRLANADEWRQVLESAIPLCEVVFASRSELIDLWGTESGAYLIDQGILDESQTLVVTDGAQGSWAEKSGKELTRASAYPVKHVEDVVGAGDGFAGGVLAARYRRWSWSKSLDFGSVVGAFAVAHPGDWEGYPSWDDVISLNHGQWVER